MKKLGNMRKPKQQEESTDMIMKKLGNMGKPKTTKPKIQKESADVILNRLILGSGIKRRVI